jgi:nucleotide-binding universal stress UspA family protein
MNGDYFLVVLGLALAYFLRSRPEVSLALTYLMLSFLTCFTAGKMGANTNYLLEWQAAICLCAGVGYQFVRAQSDRGSLVYALLPATLSAILVTSLRPPRPDPIMDSGCRQAYEYVMNYPGQRILSENPGAAVVAGKSSQVFEPFLWTREVVNEGWPDTEIVNLIRSRKIDLIVLGSPAKSRASQVRWSNSVAEAIEENYRPVQMFACKDARFVYQPKGLAQ